MYIKAMENDSAVDNPEIFLDIQARVDNTTDEEGLLGLAFIRLHKQSVLLPQLHHSK